MKYVLIVLWGQAGFSVPFYTEDACRFAAAQLLKSGAVVTCVLNGGQDAQRRSLQWM